MVRAFDHLWKARRQGNGKNETVALHLIGSLYEKAGRTGDALTYFERARASLLAHNAQLLDRIGNKEEAALSRQQALQVFKKLDHARYLEMMGDGGRPGTLSSN
jgi:tetratricopeptide (TPR) repeat protein